MTSLSSETVHASCVAIGDRAVLIEGRSGAGKSDLALRLIDRGARLVSDDYTQLIRHGRALIAQPPERIAGQIEVRGVGIIAMPHVARVEAALVVALDEPPERLPEPRTRRFAGIELPVIAIDGALPSAPIKVELALRQMEPPQ